LLAYSYPTVAAYLADITAVAIAATWVARQREADEDDYGQDCVECFHV
jgi:hypothetical protein